MLDEEKTVSMGCFRNECTFLPCSDRNWRRGRQARSASPHPPSGHHCRCGNNCRSTHPRSPLGTKLSVHRQVQPCDEGSQQVNRIGESERDEKRRHRETNRRYWQKARCGIQKTLFINATAPARGKASSKSKRSKDCPEKKGRPDDETRNTEFRSHLKERVVWGGAAQRPVELAGCNLWRDRALRTSEVPDPDAKYRVLDHVAHSAFDESGTPLATREIVIVLRGEDGPHLLPVARRRCKGERDQHRNEQ